MDASSDKSPMPIWLRQPAATGFLAGMGLVLVVGLTLVHAVVGLAAAALVLVGAIFIWRGIRQDWDQAELRRLQQEQVLRDERQRLEKEVESAATTLRQEQEERAADRMQADEEVRRLQSESQELASRIQKLEAEQARWRSDFEQERGRLQQEVQAIRAKLQQAEDALKQAREEGQRVLREAQEKAERALKQVREEGQRALQQAQGERDQARRQVQELQGAYDGLDKKWRADLNQEARPPLTALMGFAQLLEIDPLSPEQLHNVQQVLKGSRHVLAWIEERLKER